MATLIPNKRTETLDPNAWKYIPATSDLPAYHVFLKPIEKPALDTREYQLLQLENGLQALLVHDKDADTSAAAMDIAVGHLSDPDDMPGLAHFCEHMLFLGTEQFPKENGYNEYISAHGGHTNAYTAASNTNYYFCVSSTSTPHPSARSTPGNMTPSTDPVVNAVPLAVTPTKVRAPLPVALEMFASFFHSPLFSSSGTARELNAVDSEHKKNSQSDRWRIFQLGKGLSRDIAVPTENGETILKKHPWAKFGSGNKGTLSAFGRVVASENAVANGKVNGNANGNLAVDPANPLPPLASESEPDGGSVGAETRRRLVEWWKNEYCAGRMKLTILGRESLDELTQLTVKLFSPVVNRGQDPAPQITTPPLGENELGTVVQVKTVMDFRALDITFCIPWQAPHYLSKPASFIGHFAGHEGPGSLHSYLKNKGWISGVSAGSSTLGRGFGRFAVYIQLTKEGMDNYKSVLKAVYKYLDILRAACGSASSNADSTSLDNYHYSEIKALADIHFRFSEKVRAENYVSDVAAAMNRPYAPEHILSGPARVWESDEKAVKDLLDLLKPENSRVLLMAREFPEVTNGISEGQIEGWQTDKWYTTEYRVVKLDDDVIHCITPGSASSENIPQLYLPGPNDFIPSALSVDKVEIAEPAKSPTRIHSSSLSTLWFKKDDQFWVPKAGFYAYVVTPLANATPRLAVKSRIYTELVCDALTEYSYAASLAGLGYSFSSYDRGIFYNITGYNEKIGVFSQKVLETMRNLKMDPERFKVIKDDLKEDWDNFDFIEPYRIADYWSDYLVAESVWTPKERLAELDTITVDDIEAHKHQLLSRVHIETLAHGNITEAESKHLLESAEKTLGSRPVTATERQTERSLLVPEGSNFIYKTSVPNPKEVNSCLVYTCQVGSITDRTLTALNGLLLHMMREPAFDELRTKQQLGYVVFVTRHESRGIMGTKILIQSERGPEYLESRVDEFLTEYRAQLEKTTLEEFQRQKEGLISAKLERLTNLHAECRRFWSRIVDGYCDFTRHEIEVEVLQEATLENLLDFFDTYIHPASTKRRKLSVHLSSQLISDATTPANGKVSTPAPTLRFSVAASEEFLTLLKKHNIPTQDEALYRKLSKAEPPVQAVKTFWVDYLKKFDDSAVSSETKELLLNAIEELALTHPRKEEDGGDSKKAAVEVKIGVKPVLIEDIPAFKAHLPLGPAAVPVSTLTNSTRALLLA